MLLNTLTYERWVLTYLEKPVKTTYSRHIMGLLPEISMHGYRLWPPP